MIQRGRPSSAAIALISHGDVQAVHRPRAPASLNEEQAEEWRKVVNGMPADHFPPETHALLEQRCRHVIWARRLAQAIEAEEKSEEFDTKKWRDLLRSAAEQSTCISMLDTKMRLAQQTTHDRRKRKSTVSAAPWKTTEGQADEG